VSLREAAQQAFDLLMDTQIPATPDVDAVIIALSTALSEQDEIDLTTVYLAGRMDEQKVQRKPLTDEEIVQISIDTPVNLYAFARAIERAHGIKQYQNEAAQA
jgi:hypothetical protein